MNVGTMNDILKGDYIRIYLCNTLLSNKPVRKTFPINSAPIQSSCRNLPWYTIRRCSVNFPGSKKFHWYWFQVYADVGVAASGNDKKI